jgi:mannosidase alpha-like ER degradation enhancer 2
MTGMPYGTVNLRYGVPSGETPVVATAGAGSFILEFGALSRLTGDRRFEAAARRTLYALFRRKSQKDLFAQHINAENGVWHGSTASTGNYIDSFYEYVLKGHLLLGDPQDLAMFRTMYTAAKKHLTFGAFSVEADLNSGTFPRPGALFFFFFFFCIHRMC